MVHLFNNTLDESSFDTLLLFLQGEGMKVETKWLGRISYSDGLKLQKKFIEQSRDAGSCYLLGLEHESVITLGLGAKDEDVLVPFHILEQKNIEVIWVKRGGKVTCHSPGQIVIYPIVPLKKLKISVRQYIYLLEDTTRTFLEYFGIDCLARNPKIPTGVYTQRGKIAFFGINIQKNIACHGLSINISNDLSLFSLIRSCGVDSEKMDCVSYYHKLTPSPVLLKKLGRAFSSKYCKLY